MSEGQRPNPIVAAQIAGEELPKNNVRQTIDRMTLQRAEFDAFDRLASHYRDLCNTPIVDDDYPEVRHGFEGALANFLSAMKANGRFVKGNRYGLKDIQG